MAKKDKALENAAKIWKEKQAEKASKPKATVPEAGKAQVEIVDVFLGKDHFENKAYEFELKVVGGVNMGRKFTKHLGMECKKAPDGFTADDVVGWSVDALDKLGCTSIDRDEVESLAGAVANVTFHRKKGADATKWPTIYFNSLETPAPEGDDEEEETSSSDDGDDEFSFVEGVN